MNDSELVQRLGERDPAAFQCLTEHYLPSVWRFVYARVDGDSHVAEDIVSETVLALVRVVTDESAPPIENPGGWLRSVALRKVQDHYRAAARVRHLIDDAQPDNSPDRQDDPARRHEKQEKRAEVRRAMDQLSEQHRLALEWKYLDKLSVREIAGRWEITEKAVESILFRARRELRTRLLRTDVADDLPTQPGSAGSDPTHNGPTKNIGPTTNCVADNGPTNNGPTNNGPTNSRPTNSSPNDCEQTNAKPAMTADTVPEGTCSANDSES